VTHYLRAPIARILDRGETTTVLGPRGARTFDGDSAELVRAVLEVCARGATRDELIAELGERAGETVPAEIVDQVLALLEEDRAIVREAARPQATVAYARRRVVLAISGAVAAIDAPVLVRGLQAIGCDVRIAVSRKARRFVSTVALEALVHDRVWSSMWHRDDRTAVPHITLAEWAELVLVCPASATTVARIAHGDCSDLVAAIACATRAPVVIAPSMNDAMYASPAVQDNLATLRRHGRVLVHPSMGVELAHRPEERRSMLGPAPPAEAIVDIVRHVLPPVAPQLPVDAAGWERLWTTVPAAQLPWHADAIEPPLATALEARRGDGRRPVTCIDLGTGAGTVAIEAARRGFAVTATDVSAAALGLARARAGDLPILFVLDDVTHPRLDARFDVAVDCGLLHCLPRDRWAAYARSVGERLAPGGSLLVVAHTAAGMATTPVALDDLRELFPALRLARVTPTTLSRAGANLYELEAPAL
jgi:3-polyprenyl-4-hydroxybenzoate decarboxylase